jgi:PLP dependent protein
MPDIARNLEAVLSQLSAAAAKAGRQPNEIKLVAVTKTHPSEILREAIAAGQTLFGESKVQEARAKIPLLPSNLKWHFIGHLQKNKVRHALSLFELIHSVDSLDLAQQMQRVAREDGLYPRVLLEVNVAGEGTKFGFSPETLNASMEQLVTLDRLSIEGLMTIPPIAEEAESSRRYFVSLRQLRDKVQEDFKVELPELSMGMTDDFAIAVEEGATFVRVGTAVFGPRRQAKRERP